MGERAGAGGLGGFAPDTSNLLNVDSDANFNIKKKRLFF